MTLVLEQRDIERFAKLMVELKTSVPGNWRPMNMLGGTKPFAAIEETQEPGKGQIFFVATWEEAQILSGAFNLVDIAMGRFTMVGLDTDSSGVENAPDGSARHHAA